MVRSRVFGILMAFGQLGAGHERRREPGAGQPRDRASKLKNLKRARSSLPSTADFHRRRHTAGLHADSGRAARDLPGQPDRGIAMLSGRPLFWRIAFRIFVVLLAPHSLRPITPP